ncbi:hypothetical protein TI05_14735 [Achromatium sp. WMS3]|nr:hypothetical protein TI05_14735 [Achromatium sp. WMS3]
MNRSQLNGWKMKPQKYNIEFSNLQAIYNELISDVETAKKLDTNCYSEEFIKRTYTHSFFAMVEGVISQLKQIALQANKQTHVFKAYEIEILSEQSSYLENNGIAKQKNAKLKLMPNILFSLNYTAKALVLDFKVKTNNDGYESMLKAIKIRDRITHPKNKESLIISDQDIVVLGKASAWFRDEAVRLLNQIHEIV